MKEKSYRIVSPLHLVVAALLLTSLALVCGAMVYAQQLLHSVLDGGQGPQQESHVTQFSLREQMMKSQIQTRVRGWLSVVAEEEAELKTKRGMLRASLFEPVSESADAPWALVLHGGLGTDRTQVLDVACELSLAGYRVLAPDLYAHGKSDGTISSLGLADAWDVEAWCKWIVERDETARIVLFGQSEGGMAVLLAAAKGLPAQVYAAAADSAYASVSEHLYNLLYRRSGCESDVQKRLIAAVYRFQHGIDLREGELTKQLSGCEMPLLLIHGTGDNQVPAWNSEDIVLAAGKNAQLLFAEGAQHGMARYADSQKIYKALLGFFEESL